MLFPKEFVKRQIHISQLAITANFPELVTWPWLIGFSHLKQFLYSNVLISSKESSLAISIFIDSDSWNQKKKRKKKVTIAMKPSVYFPKTPWIIAFLLPIFTFACGSFSNSTVFIISIITFIILISSTFLFSNDKLQVLEVEDEPKIETLHMGSPESYSENEIIGRFSPTSEEDSDSDSRSPGCSDDSISDEEGLIEIELPAGNYVHRIREEELGFQPFLPEISPIIKRIEV